MRGIDHRIGDVEMERRRGGRLDRESHQTAQSRDVHAFPQVEHRRRRDATLAIDTLDQTVAEGDDHLAVGQEVEVRRVIETLDHAPCRQVRADGASAAAVASSFTQLPSGRGPQMAVEVGQRAGGCAPDARHHHDAGRCGGDHEEPAPPRVHLFDL